MIWVVAPIVSCFVLEVLYRDPLHQMTMDNVPQQQEDWQGTGTETLLKYVAMFGSFKALFVYLIFCFNHFEKPNALYLISSIAFIYAACHNIKSAYKEERPYLIDQEIVSTECDTGFANPSSVICINMFFWTALYLQVFFPHSGTRDEDRGIIRILGIFFCSVLLISFIVLLMLSRVYQGVNAWNDVVFGASLGGVLGHIGNYWYYPYCLNYSEKRIQEAEGGNDAYIHVSFLDYGKVIVFTAALPMFVTMTVFQSHKGEIDWEF